MKGRVMAFPGLALPDCSFLHFLIFLTREETDSKRLSHLLQITQLVV